MIITMEMVKKKIKGRENGMKRNRKTAWAWNILLVLVCIALTVCFGGLLAWDAKQRRLEVRS